MKFKIIEDGKEILCDIVMTFKDDGNNVNYIVYTDGTKDENGDLEIYASRYEIDDGKYILNPIEKDSEWNLIDLMLESKNKEVDKYDKN